MKKYFLFILAVGLLCGVSRPAHASCVNSPENPTAVLGLVGSAGALLTFARARLKGRR